MVRVLSLYMSEIPYFGKVELGHIVRHNHKVVFAGVTLFGAIQQVGSDISWLWDTDRHNRATCVVYWEYCILIDIITFYGCFRLKAIPEVFLVLNMDVLQWSGALILPEWGPEYWWIAVNWDILFIGMTLVCMRYNPSNAVYRDVVILTNIIVLFADMLRLLHIIDIITLVGILLTCKWFLRFPSPQRG